MTSPDRFSLHVDRAALLIIDVQTRLAAAMEPDWLRQVVKNTVTLIQGAKILGLPILVTEQYPKGIGPTLQDVMAALGPEQAIQEKLSFSCMGEPSFMEALERTRRQQIIVAGMETHVCVFQTLRDLLVRNVVTSVFAVEDAMISRTRDNHHLGLAQMALAGAVRTGTESVLFDLLGRAGTPEFKAISKLVK